MFVNFESKNYFYFFHSFDFCIKNRPNGKCEVILLCYTFSTNTYLSSMHVSETKAAVLVDIKVGSEPSFFLKSDSVFEGIMQVLCRLS